MESWISFPIAAAKRFIPQHVMDLSVEVGEAGSPCGPHVAAAPFSVAEPSMPDVEMEMDNLESDSDYATSSGSESDCQEGDECIPDTATTGCPHYILPAPPPIPRLADVPCFFQQHNLD
ncbi:hypothetical protein PIB30_064148 [Stylosanthes scabra]|uniref:Uncharacterized protein n=1 Tax=Stylosanthes scabra TaxID=79078 RepID=A0ABU6TLE2_9FABA|nr:hypothetical protein [Stylosanthes scabra]